MSNVIYVNFNTKTRIDPNEPKSRFTSDDLAQCSLTRLALLVEQHDTLVCQMGMTKELLEEGIAIFDSISAKASSIEMSTHYDRRSREYCESYVSQGYA